MTKNKIRIIFKDKQKTISSSVSFTDTDPLFGNKITVTLNPAKENTGITFIVDKQHIKASVENCYETDMHITALSDKDKIIHVTEHLLSAIHGLGIDNMIIEVSGGNTIPLLDASAKEFIKYIETAGTTTQNAPKRYIKITETFIIKDPQSDSFALFTERVSGLYIESIIDFPESVIGTQNACFEITEESYKKEIAPARTFFHKPFTPERWEKIKKMYKGVPEKIEDCPIIHWNGVFGKDLRFENEPARHKILDFIGDISLSNSYIQGSVLLYKPSHRFNRNISKYLNIKSMENIKSFKKDCGSMIKSTITKV